MTILHETARRLRLGVPPDAHAATLRAGLSRLPGVASVRVNAQAQCVVVQHDGRFETRAAVLNLMRAGVEARPQRHRPAKLAAISEVSAWTPALLAATLPVLPQGWRRNAALALIATRVLSQPARLRSDAPAVLLDAASLAALAISGQPMVVTTSVLLRLLSERLSARLVRQADGLLDHLLPTEAAGHTALRASDAGSGWAWWPLRALRAGDRIRLFPGDVVPVDGCVVDGTATLAAAAQQGEMRTVTLGEHLSAGERLHEGRLELHAEADAASSRLQRLRAHLRHAVGTHDPTGPLVPDLGRLLSLPLTAAALVFGLTGDSARAAAMLQADPQQGLDLALPLGREAALYALARHGLLTSGLAAIERLATARTLVLQDTGVLASGRWTIESVHTEADGDADLVRGWLAALAGTPVEALEVASFPDRTVRLWVRHGAVLRVGQHEVHLASRQRLQQVWGRASTNDPAARTSARSSLARSTHTPTDTPTQMPTDPPERLRRELAVVADGRVVARVVMASALRPAVADRLAELAALGFEQVAVFVEFAGDGDADSDADSDAEDDSASDDNIDGSAAPSPFQSGRLRGLTTIADDVAVRSSWLANASQDGTPLVMLHTALRDLVPPGSLSLSPMDSDAGSHGALLGDPLRSLVAARRVAQLVHRRLRVQQGTAVAANSLLMTAAGLRWLPPIATTLLHHGHVLLLLLDSLRIEQLAARPASPTSAHPRHAPQPSPRNEATSQREGHVPETDIPRSEPA